MSEGQQQQQDFDNQYFDQVNSRKNSQDGQPIDYDQQQQPLQQNGESNQGSRLSSANKHQQNFFDGVNESPFKNTDGKDYGQKYNKVINRLRDSNSLNDLARKYNKMQLPTNSQNNLEESDFKQQQQQQQLFNIENSNSGKKFRQLSPKQNLNSSFQTPLKDVSIGALSHQKSKAKRKIDSLELRSSQLSLLSRKSNDSAIPSILNQIQQNQKKYKSPRAYGMYYNLSNNTTNYNLGTQAVNLQNDQQLQQEQEQIQSQQQQNSSNRGGAYHLKKNFRNFLQDLNLGQGFSQQTKRVKSPSSNFLRQASPTNQKNYNNILSHYNTSNNSVLNNINSSNSNIAQSINQQQQQLQQLQSQNTFGQKQGGFDDLLNKISQKKKQHSKQLSSSNIQKEFQLRSSRQTANFSKKSTGKTTGKTFELEKDLDNMRLSSMFKFTTKSPNRKMFSSPGFKKNKLQ